MKADFEQKLLITEQFGFVFGVDQFVHILTILNLVVCNERLQLGEVTCVLSHICCKNHTDYSLSEQLEFLFIHVFSEV